MKIIGVGNALVDILISLPNEKFLIDNALPKGSMQLIDSNRSKKLLKLSRNMPNSMASGGSAANTIHGLAKLGIETAFFGSVGRDHYGTFFQNDLELAGIKPYLLKRNSETGIALTFITPDSERTFGTCLGAAVEIDNQDISFVNLMKYSHIHIEGYLIFNTSLVTHIVKTARDAGLIISLDLASYNVVEANLSFLKEIVAKYVDIIFANEDEAKAFTGKQPREALDVLGEYCKTVIVKTGPHGSWVKSGNDICHVSAVDADVIDTTGAGDLYAAGFLYGISKDMSAEEAAKTGSLIAANVIEIIGAKMDNKKWDFIIRKISK